MNKLVLIGNLTADPAVRVVNTASGQQTVCNFNIAVNRRVGGQEQVQYFGVTVWPPMAEHCAKYLAKGRKVCVVGPVSFRTYTAKDGTVRGAMEVVANEVEFLGGGQGGERAGAAAPVEEKRDEQTGFTAVETDELPF